MVWHHHVKVKQNEWWFVTLVNQTVETNSSLVILFFFLSSVAIIMRYQAKQTYQKIWRRFSISFELWTKLTQQNENYRLIFIVRLHEHLVESMLNWLAHYLCFQRTDQMYRYSILLPNGNFKCKQNHEETKERKRKTKERKEESPKRFGVVEFRWQSINMLVVNSVGKKDAEPTKWISEFFVPFPLSWFVLYDVCMCPTIRWHSIFIAHTSFGRPFGIRFLARKIHARVYLTEQRIRNNQTLSKLVTKGIW